MDTSLYYQNTDQEFNQKNSINRYLTMISSSLLAGGVVYSLTNKETCEAWLFRDDIGAPHGIKGYEE